jgi:hypothetical protein
MLGEGDEMRVSFSRSDRLSYDFFRLFSRAEYALKAEAYFKLPKPQENGELAVIRAEPDWECYAKDVSAAFQAMIHQEDPLRQAVESLRAQPPRKQVIKAGKLDWEPMDGIDGEAAPVTKDILRTIRNNLFHGGKWGPGGWENVERTDYLLSAAIIALNGLLLAKPRVWARVQRQ